MGLESRSQAFSDFQQHTSRHLRSVPVDERLPQPSRSPIEAPISPPKIAGAFSSRLIEARDVFLAGEKKNKKEVTAYELEQDTMLYRVLSNEQGTAGYDEAKASLDAYTKMQLETHIGERLHVGISRFEYRIVDGELRTEDTDEPIVAMIERGRDYRREKGKPVDWDRETAEVAGMKRIQKTLAAEPHGQEGKKAPIGTMMLFASPQGDVENGSIYKQNFYEVQQKIPDGTVVAHRFTSGLTLEETKERLSQLDSRYKRDIVPTAAEFIANPIRLDPGSFGLNTPEDIHKFMHKDHDYMSKKKFDVVRKACEPIIAQYIQSLTDNPKDTFQQEKLFRAILNYADNVADELKNTPDGRVIALNSGQDSGHVRPLIPRKIDIAALAKQKVRFVDTGCGGSGDSSSATSVSEFGKKREVGKNGCPDCNTDTIDNHYHCPQSDCKKRYDDETAKNPEERTTLCPCGFEFGCK